MKQYTYGVELELGNIDVRRPLPDKCYFTGDPDVCNEYFGRGIACDPKRIDVLEGAEVNTQPTNSIPEMIQVIDSVFKNWPEAKVNHRMALHCHIAWPGIKEDFQSLQKILQYTNDGNGQFMLDNYWVITQTPEMTAHTRKFMMFDHTVMPDWRYKAAMAATSVKEFREAHAISKEGKVVWATTKRHAINIYSVYTNGAIEFRWFFPTTDIKLMEQCFLFMKRWVDEALGSQTPVKDWFHEYTLPPEPKYNHQLETDWINTNFKYNEREVALENISRVKSEIQSSAAKELLFEIRTGGING